MTLRGKLLTEVFGSFVFMTVVALSGYAGSLAPLAIGLGLAAMVYMGGHVSGAHYNPAISFGLFLRRVIDAPTMLLYWAAQIIGGIAAFALAYALSGHTPGIRPGASASILAAVVAEIVFTAAVVTVVLNVAATKETAGNSFYGIAIGFTVAAGAFVVGPISGAAFNPAVAIGATVVAAVARGGPLGYVWIYLVGPLAGAAAAAAIHFWQTPATAVPPETTERIPAQTR